MSLFNLCTSHWKEISAVSSSLPMSGSRSVGRARVRPPEDLPVWLASTLLPALRERLKAVAPQLRVQDAALAAAGLMASLAGRRLAASPPPPDVLAQVETLLFDPGGSVLPVAGDLKGTSGDPVLDSLTQRLLAIGCGSGRPGVHDSGARGWTAIWPQAQVELGFETQPHIHRLLKKLFEHVWGASAAIRPHIGLSGASPGQEFYDWLGSSAARLTAEFIMPLPPESLRRKVDPFLHLDCWDPGKGNLPGWIRTMLEGTARPTDNIQMGSFCDGHFAKLVIKDKDGAGDGEAQQLIAADVALRTCFNAGCADHGKNRPAFKRPACPTCGSGEDVFASARWLVPFDPDESHYERGRFLKCMAVGIRDHYIRVAWNTTAGNLGCPMHPGSRMSRQETNLWMQKPPPPQRPDRGLAHPDADPTDCNGDEADGDNE